MFHLYDLNSSLIKTTYKSLSGIPLNGTQFAYVPDSIRVNPKDLAFDRDAVLASKWNGILAESPFYEFILIENLLDTSSWDLGSSEFYGVGNTTWLLGSRTGLFPPTLQTNEYDISGDGTFDVFKVYWEVYTLVRVQTGDRIEVFYQPVLPSALNVSLSIDGIGWEPVEFMERLATDPTQSVWLKFETEASAPSIPVTLPGFEPLPTEEPVASADRYYIGSFAIFY